ncbi:hypothetical protein RRG08_005975 [Elysia crispata]|uniref:Uncharacterized protein n=1 Tax=Elysia crispata TaxID=231223 RepID=A0AAE0YR22_9GAST|nr:hypothetical protein RRG08_005975 [Elysia crispata]
MRRTVLHNGTSTMAQAQHPFSDAKETSNRVLNLLHNGTSTMAQAQHPFSDAKETSNRVLNRDVIVLQAALSLGFHDGENDSGVGDNDIDEEEDEDEDEEKEEDTGGDSTPKTPKASLHALEEDDLVSFEVLRAAMLSSESLSSSYFYDEESGSEVALQPAMTSRSLSKSDPEAEFDVTQLHCRDPTKPLSYTNCLILFFLTSPSTLVRSFCDSKMRNVPRHRLRILLDQLFVVALATANRRPQSMASSQRS